MAKIHVLSTNGPHQYRVVVHIPTPTDPANNSAGVPWPTAVINSGRNVTIMPEGDGPGQITASERAGVLAGTILEDSFTFTDNPAWTAQQRNAALDAAATQCAKELRDRYGDELKWFGATRP